MFILGALVALAWGQEEWYNHPELEWQSFETEHFLIHFHHGTERSAREAATVAEKIYGPVTRIYNYEPPTRTQIIIKDVDDVSNGIAYYYDNKIEIWARPMDFDLRGSHRWMQDVITHEFVHIIQMATAMKFSSRVPGLYFQALGYEEEKREDVLYGYPNVLVSYPYPGVNIPPWFAEGVAQIMYPGANYDYWDTHRDMILRDRVLNGNLLSFTAMNSFGKRGTGNESVYNHGFAFIRFLVDRFGLEVVEAISRIMAAPLTISVSRAMEHVTGVPGPRLYQEWKAELEEHYDRAMVNVSRHEVSGEILVAKGSTNIHPVWHPTERKFAFLSDQRSDFFGQTDLYIYDFETGRSKRIADIVESAPCWSADGQTLYYAGRSKPGKTGARWLDLFAYDVDRRKKERLTHGERVTAPIIVNDGQAIAYLTVTDGTSSIRLIDLATGGITTLRTLEDGDYIHSLTYS
ncbi:MAG: TolB family protein, partial [Candidatus Neomarinimicrobiota bacterium]